VEGAQKEEEEEEEEEAEGNKERSLSQPHKSE
jgi:hypothetical protein